MGAQVEADLSLDNAVDEQAQHREHRQRRDPFGLLQSHRAEGRGILDPAKARFRRSVLLLIAWRISASVQTSALTVVASTDHLLSSSELSRASTSTTRR
jgi:hypothetical protein